MSYYCVFCEIIAGREPADVRYEDEHVIVFKNRLNWVPVMLLAVPKEHMTQGELWTSDALTHVARAAAEDRTEVPEERLVVNHGVGVDRRTWLRRGVEIEIVIQELAEIGVHGRQIRVILRRALIYADRVSFLVLHRGHEISGGLRGELKRRQIREHLPEVLRRLRPPI